MEGFVHSVKVPTQYRKTAAVLKKALEGNKSIKTLIFEEKHARLQGMQAVLKHYAENRGAIDAAIEKTQILKDNPRLGPELCKILISELIFGRKTLKGEKSKPVSTVLSYHEKLLAALKGEGDGGELGANTTAQKIETPPRYVRVNSNLVSMADALAMLEQENWHRKQCPPFEVYSDYLKAVQTLEEHEFMLDMHLEDMLVFHPKQRQYWALHEWVKQKKFMLQDKSTGLVAELLHPPPHAVVLDMCAAPGMKTIHTCNVMQNTGTIFAVERDNRRYELLNRMITAAGCQNVKPIHADALQITAKDCPNVEYIVLDPSCSGVGMQSRLSLVSEKKDPQRLFKLAGLQIKLLSHAMTAFPHVKRISYSTCSLYEEENEQVVQRCLERNPSFKLLSAKKALRNKWQNVGDAQYKKIGKNCIYTRPESDNCDGLFVALFEKQRTEENV